MATIAAALSAASGAARAQTTGGAASGPFSGRVLKFEVGFPAGGVADFAARTMADGLAQGTGATCVVENRAGAGGNLATEFVARASADSGTYGFLANSQLTTNAFVPQLAPKNFDPFKDLIPVAAVCDTILMFAASSALGVNSMDEFLAKARAPGARMRLGLAGIGTAHHLSSMLLMKAANIEATLVPYKGGAPMIADAAGGHLDAVFTTIPVGGPMVNGGKMRWLAVAHTSRLAVLPDVPPLSDTLKNASVPSWSGVFAPAGTPKDQISAMHAAVNAAVNSPAVANKLRGNGLEPLSMSQAEFSAKLADEAKFMKDFLSKVTLDFST